MHQDRNRRRHDRVPAQLPVRIATIDPETDRWTGRPFFRHCREWSGNLSAGGLFVRTREPIHPGRRVLVEISLPGGESLEAVGRVAWTRGAFDGTDPEAGIGLQFVGAAEDSLARLQRFLRARSHADAPASA